MKKLLSLILALSLIFGIISPLVINASAGEDDITGDCGENVTYILNQETGSLRINGTGDMYDYARSPFYFYRDEIKTVYISYGITSIGDYLLAGCTKLPSVTIPGSVKKIGYRAFSGCTGLTSIAIPGSVTSIGEETFSWCSGLTSIIIPGSVTSIGINAFSGTSYYDNASNWVNGVLYISNALIKAKDSLNGSYSVKSGTTCIADVAFLSCTGLTNVIIPGSVKGIGNYAFDDCSGLTEVSISKGVTSIGERAFSGCSGLTSVTIPDSVTSIGEDVFSYCRGLTSISIPDSVTSIEKGTFSGCSGLTSITIPDSVTSIGEDAFSGCSGLTSVTIPDGVTNIERETFYWCTGLKSITIPDSVTSIGREAFYHCSALTSITLPDSVASIDDWAFRYCDNLTDVYYAGMEEDWNKISIGENNECLTNATIHFNSTGDDGGNDDGVKYTIGPLIGTLTSLLLYKDGELVCRLESDDGGFPLDDVEQGTYTVYVICNFGVLTKIKEELTVDGTEPEPVENVYIPIGDVNGDGIIDVSDLSLILMDGIYATDNEDYDIDGSGAVDINDVSTVLLATNYGAAAALRAE